MSRPSAVAPEDRTWPLIVRHVVGEQDRFTIARHFGNDLALESLEHCRQYLHDEGWGGLEEIISDYQDLYDEWVAAGRPRRWTKRRGQPNEEAQ